MVQHVVAPPAALKECGHPAIHSQLIVEPQSQQHQWELPSDNIQIRAAAPGDARKLRALIQELADHHDMSDAPKIGAERIAADLKAGVIHSVVAMDGAEMAAYAIYYLPSSSGEGPVGKKKREK